MMSRRAALRAMSGGFLALTAGCLAGRPGGEQQNELTTTVETQGGRQPLLTVHRNGTQRPAVVYAQVESVGEIRAAERNGEYLLPITLSDDGVQSLADAFRELGIFNNSEEGELGVHHGGEVVFTAALAPSIVRAIETGEFDGEVTLRLPSRETAENLRAAVAENR